MRTAPCRFRLFLRSPHRHAQTVPPFRSARVHYATNTQQYNAGFQQPYPHDGYASPSTHMSHFQQPPYNTGGDPYQSPCPDRHFSELSFPDLGGRKGFMAYKDAAAYENMQHQTVSPPSLRYAFLLSLNSCRGCSFWLISGVLT